MNTLTSPSKARRSSLTSQAGFFLAGMLAALSSMPATAAVDLAQTPLSIGGNVPGNLSLVPSVEFPTLISVANFGPYNSATTYVGYFNADKCYRYIYSNTESDRHFAPNSVSTGHACSNPLWSGNYLNWAATQTIDPFRAALTGGYRVRDTITETWIEKAKSDRDGGTSATANFPRRTFPDIGTNATAVAAATPASWGSIRTRIDGLGNKMRFTSGGNAAALDNNNPGTGQPVAYDPSLHTLSDASLVTVNGVPVSTANVVWEVSVRVAVCVAGMLESNCNTSYSGVAKPEGLIQEYSNQLRYSIFGYLNNGGATEPEGGVLRANQKFVGPNTHYPDVAGAQVNAAREWDPSTGILIVNPDSADATATAASGIVNSGVINYLNKFGQMETGRNAKSYDNVSELYYTAVRYFKNLGNVPSYSTLSSTDYQLADGFPVITNWQDPIRYQCQTNVILGIGDTNTWRDKNLPGATSAAGEPAKPAEVSADTTVDVVASMKKIWQMEGRTDAQATTLSTTSGFNDAGRQNSAYIAALAYDSHTRDIRPTGSANAVAGNQTISTYWVDVVENRDYKGISTNQYWLATKYGGFTVPTGYDPATNITALSDAQWWTTGDYVTNPATNTNVYQRPKNFFVASDAARMVDSLKRVFAKIVSDMRGSGGSFAANSTKLETGTMTFQAQFYSGSWRGELSAFRVNSTTGALTPAWNASSQFPAWASRKIYVNNDGTQAGYKLFTYPNLSSANATALGSQAVVDYLRGDRSNEAPSGVGLRTRESILGDIVNSQPVFVGAPNGRLFYGQEFTGADDFGAYVAAQTTRTPVVYVGANDGMLHGFNANTGAETYAFVPKAAIAGGLVDYTNPDYAHRYFVDGELTVADAYLAGAWKTILVGTMGRGGKGIYALDITDPADVKFLWEKSATDIPQLGNSIGKPVIAQLADGDWRVMVGNGPNSTGDAASLITVNLGTGAVTNIPTGAAAANGLSAVNAWSTGATDFVDALYAGDLRGNVWKVTNLTGTPTVLNLFQAAYSGTPQPITSAPLVSKNPADDKTWVFVGTGRYLNVDDLANKDVQSWYGLIDDGTAITGRAQLVQTQILSETTIGGLGARVISDNVAPGLRGWFMDLVSPVAGAEGERMVVPNFFQGLALIGTTRIPDTTNVCNPSGKGYVMAINPFTGGRLSQSFFDMNGDGVFNNSDLVNGAPVSGIGLPSGPNNPIFIGDIIQINLDDATSIQKKTNSNVLVPSRVSWREVVGD